MTKYTKSSDGCCHKTVIGHCEECPYKSAEKLVKQIRLPTPVPDSIVGLEALVGALLRACGVVEGFAALTVAGETPSLRTSLVRRLIKENT